MTAPVVVLAALLLPIQPIPARADLEMMAAVEDFARATPPEPYRSMIAALGASKWAERDAASKALESAVCRDRSAVRWLFVGRRDRDLEIAARCNGAIRRLHRCPDCKGSGWSKAWAEYPCSACEGTATDWPFSMFD